MKRIGILTSGGDAPAMNAAIRAVARKALSNGLEAYGINYGFAGLVAGDIHKFSATDLDDSIDEGGTMLYSARYPEFAQVEGQLKGIEQLKKFGIDALVVIGGDGSYHGALCLTEHGYNTIGLPGTIDNDIPYTDFTIGFDTALNTAVEAIDKIRDTAKSHQRVFAVQVMGREAADIALWAGVATGADAIVAPGYDTDVKEIAEKLKKNRVDGKDYGIVVIAEGDANSDAAPAFLEELKKYGDFDAHAVVLGHVQRGGRPTARDRVLASKMGAYAVDLLLEGKGGLAVEILDNKIQAHDITDLFNSKHKPDSSLFELNNDLSFK